MHFIAALLFNTLALLITAYLVPGFEITHIASALLAAIVIGLMNALIRPILLFITAPINFLTLGIFAIIVNSFTLWLSSLFVPGFKIEGFMAALAGIVVLSLITTGLNLIRREVNPRP